MKKAYITLSENTIFDGLAPREQEGVFFGEVVFTTGMTGYVESLTDPSYSGQILVFTYPLIGNYGISGKETWESEKIHAVGVIVSEASESFANWLKQQNVPLMTGVDTRALTKHLRSLGTMLGQIRSTKSEIRNKFKFPKFQTPFISISKPEIYNAKFKQTIILVDCGMKQNILRELLKMDYRIKRVPRDYDYSGEEFAGVFLSNGPGDPVDYKETIRVTRSAMRQNRPIMGICLGSQIMGLAAGAKTYKLKFGHRGHNQPVIGAKTEKRKAKNNCFITSQNHGYAVNEKTLPKGWYVNFRNLNDGSVEGVAHATRPFFSVQFHPEACPGPTDTKFLFGKFEALISKFETKSK